MFPVSTPVTKFLTRLLVVVVTFPPERARRSQLRVRLTVVRRVGKVYESGRKVIMVVMVVAVLVGVVPGFPAFRARLAAATGWFCDVLYFTSVVVHSFELLSNRFHGCWCRLPAEPCTAVSAHSVAFTFHFHAVLQRLEKGEDNGH